MFHQHHVGPSENLSQPLELLRLLLRATFLCGLRPLVGPLCLGPAIRPTEEIFGLEQLSNSTAGRRLFGLLPVATVTINQRTHDEAVQVSTDLDDA